MVRPCRRRARCSAWTRPPPGSTSAGSTVDRFDAAGPPPPPPAGLAPRSAPQPARPHARRRRGRHRARYGWDVTLVRLALRRSPPSSAIGIPVYVVAWIVIPPDPDDGTEPEPREAGALVGLILLGVGVLVARRPAGAERRRHLRRRVAARARRRRRHRHRDARGAVTPKTRRTAHRAASASRGHGRGRTTSWTPADRRRPRATTSSAWPQHRAVAGTARGSEHRVIDRAPRRDAPPLAPARPAATHALGSRRSSRACC